MRHPKTKAMLAYWKNRFTLANAGRSPTAKPLWPDRCDIQPADCRALLSSMFILQLQNGAAHYRLAGTELCCLYGRELKGEDFASPYTGEDEIAVQNWVNHLDGDQIAVLVCSEAQNRWGETVSLETLVLPLAHAGVQNERAIGITLAHRPPEWLGAQALVEQTIKSVRVMKPWEENGDGMTTPVPDTQTDADVIPLPGTPERIFPVPTQPHGLIHGEDPHLTLDEITGSFEPPRMVGHLQIIDGGRS